VIFCRAPELFAVPSHCDIDEKTDIWSLGCLLFALMYFKSPFDRSFTNTVPTSVANPGSGAFLIPGSGMGKNQDPDTGYGSGISYFRKLRKFFVLKILQFFDADPGSEIFLTRDPGWKKFGSGIRDLR
jgi:serine/threonine protein kinase